MLQDSDLRHEVVGAFVRLLSDTSPESGMYETSTKDG